MAKIPKTPHERGLTASTDIRIVRREISKYADPSPIAILVETYYKDVYPTAPPGAAPAPAPAVPAAPRLIPTGNAGSNQAAPAPNPALPPGMIMVGGIVVGASVGTTGRLSNNQMPRTEEIRTELVMQQRWYSPYGEAEWHDVEFTNLVEMDRRP